ncbi:MAG TPA: hypothetical protein VMH78_09215 [Thermoplasmata archaeon]|nr:hypothetical protein [Thermoplasmata archaeon]
MVEYDPLYHHVEPLVAQRLDSWVNSPPRGPTSGTWANTALADRRELVWAVATLVGDHAAQQLEDEMPASRIAYVSNRLVTEHSEAWRGLAEAYANLSPGALRRKLYRLTEVVSGVVTTEVQARPDPGSYNTSPNV